MVSFFYESNREFSSIDKYFLTYGRQNLKLINTHINDFLTSINTGVLLKGISIVSKNLSLLEPL